MNNPTPKLTAVTVFIVLMSVSFTSCMKPNPEETASRFLKAVNERNYEMARRYSTEETGKLIDLLDRLSKLSEEPLPSKRAEFEIISGNIEDDLATVRFREKGTATEQELELMKVDGEWLVNITKESLTVKDEFNESFEDDSYDMEGDIVEPDSLGYNLP